MNAMRLGQNPSKDKLPAYQPPRLGIALLAYVPSPAGYFEHVVEILKYQIASLHHATRMDFDLLVFDNGSCGEVRSELQALHADGWIDFLVSSHHNLGKIGAINWILAALPHEWICYADSDVLFRPGWIENSLKILEAFPAAGMISAQPCLDDVLRGSGSAHLGLSGDPRFQIETRLLDRQVIAEYALGVGLSAERTAQLQETHFAVATRLDRGVQAVLGASHMQFLMPREVAHQMVPLPTTYGLGREEDRNLDRKVDQAGYLHLSTPEAYVWHMGNVPDEKTLGEVQSLGLTELLGSPPSKKPPREPSRLLATLRPLARSRLLRGILYRLYNFLFRLYSQ
jgi:hypothetical protein